MSHIKLILLHMILKYTVNMSHIKLILLIWYVEAQVKFHCDPCKICGGKIGIVTGCLTSRWVCPVMYDSPSVPC